MKAFIRASIKEFYQKLNISRDVIIRYMSPSEEYDDYDDYDEDYFEDDEYFAKRKRQKTARPPSGRRGGLGAFLFLFIILIIIFIILFNADAQESIKNLFNPEPEYFREYPESVDFTFQRIITLTPDPLGSQMDYKIEIPIPEDIGAEEDPIQDVRSIQESPTASNTIPKYGSHWYYWEGEDEPTQRTLTITYDIHTESANWDIDPSESGTADDIPQNVMDAYGNKDVDEWVIRPTDPQIQALATQLTAGKSNVHSKLKAIYDYLNDNFEYDTSRKGTPQDCVYTLNMKKGDCDDQSVLFASIARAAGLAAWLEFGALYNSNDGTWTGHAWLLVYIPLHSGQGGSVNIDVVNQQFMFRDSYRFSEWSSDGNGSHLEDYYYAEGSHFEYDETYQTVSVSKSDQTVKVGEDGRPIKQVVPGFEVMILIPVLALLAFVLRRRKKFE
jgi:transglutaminase-like putative cysteine protease